MALKAEGARWPQMYDGCLIAMQADPGTADWGSDTEKRIIFRHVAEGGRVEEIENTLPVRVLPALSGRTPRTVRVNMGSAWSIFRFLADERTDLALAGSLRAAGVCNCLELLHTFMWRVGALSCD